MILKEKLEEAKILYKDANADQRYVLESLFPELAEIENTRIKKDVKRAISVALDYSYFDKETANNCLAWLEKQNPNVDNSNKEYWRGYHEGKQAILDKYAELEKQGEQKQVIDYSDSLPKDNCELVHEFVEKFERIPENEDELIVLVEYILKRKKLAEWSEEDKCMIKNICDAFEKNSSQYIWLKSLKDRVLPQSKQEWSEEDENRMDNLCNFLEEYGNSIMYGHLTLQDIISWLKSLRPKKQWKPSDGQMDSITCAVRQMKDSACYDSELMSLYQDLKRLK